MSIRKKADDFQAKLRQGIGAVFKQAPVRHSVILLVLLFAAGVVVQLAINDSSVVWPALFVIAPALVVILDNLRSRLSPAYNPWPRWFTVLVLINTVVTAIVIQAMLLGLITKSLLADILSVPFQLAVLTLLLVLLPRLLTMINRVLGMVPRFGSTLARWLSAPFLYSLLLVGWAPVLWLLLNSPSPTTTSEFWLLAALIIVNFGLAIVLRATLWNNFRYSLPVRVLPHLPAWYLVLWILIWKVEVVTEKWGIAFLGGSDLIFLTIPLALIISAFWLLQRLRHSPVAVFRGKMSDRADSIQSRVAHYVDVHGLSKRMTDSMERSDGGVFGVTGVRGTGKSALTRHVLSALEPKYFTLEVTAPVRHDQDMGFFTALCQAVCRKTLDDLDPILQGTRSGAGGKLWEKIRNPLLVICAAVAVVSLWVALPGGASRTVAVRAGPSVYMGSYIQDPLLREVTKRESMPITAERRVVDHLIAQIARTVADGGTDDGQRFLLVPSAQQFERRFWLLRQTPESAPEKQLNAHGARLKEIGLSFSPAGFLFSVLNYREQSSLIGIAGVYWGNVIQSTLKSPRLRVPLSHLFHELHYHLRTLPSGSQTPSPVADSSAAAPLDATAPLDSALEQQFLSGLILDAFWNGDPRLSFDVARLRQFQEVLQVYRHLLDGDVIPRAATQLENKAGVPEVALSQRLLHPDQGEVLVFWGALGLILLLLFAGPVWRSLSNLARAMVNRRYLDLYAEAEAFMEQLSFQSSRETSTGLSLRGISLGRKQTLASRDLTLPGLTARYTHFLDNVRSVYNGKIIIAIDELDKVHDPEEVKALLAEVKGALFSAGTFYIISISEDAARSFRSRLASGRDIFESTFDDVLDIDRIDVDAAVVILQRLEKTGTVKTRLPQKSLEVAALFGGGIPREIIRARRTLSFAMPKRAAATPAWAARTLMMEELKKWQAHLGEANLSGAATIKIRRLSDVALNDLQAGSDSTETYTSMWDALISAIQIIDPEDLRTSVGYLSEYTADSDPSNGQQAGYLRISGDLQTLLRLLILIHSCELKLRPGKTRQSYESSLLECHRALADKPALAETLLHELRQEMLEAIAKDRKNIS